MRRYTYKILSGICLMTLCWSAIAQQAGMSAKAHFKMGDTISTISTFAPSAEKCDLELNRLIKERSAVGHQLLGRTSCVSSVAADAKQLEALADQVLLDRYSGYGDAGHTIDLFEPVDLCLLDPRLCPLEPPECHPLWCPIDYVRCPDCDFIGPEFEKRIQILLEQHHFNDYLRGVKELGYKHDIDGLRSGVESILQDMDMDLQINLERNLGNDIELRDPIGDMLSPSANIRN